MTEPNPHADRHNKSGFVNRSVWYNRQMHISASKWGFAVTAQNQNVFVSVIESAWVAAWNRFPLRWVLNRGWGYNLWNRVLIWCDGEEVAHLPITDEQARSLYPNDESFNEDWGWHLDDTDGEDPAG